MHLHNYLQAQRTTVRLLLRLSTRAYTRAILGLLLTALLPETVGDDTQSQTTYMYDRTTRDTKSVAGTCASRLMTIIIIINRNRVHVLCTAIQWR